MNKKKNCLQTKLFKTESENIELRKKKLQQTSPQQSQDIFADSDDDVFRSIDDSGLGNCSSKSTSIDSTL